MMEGLTVASGTASIEIHHEITQFYNLEADLLDEHRLDEWCQLLAPDLHYWAPARTSRMPNDPVSEIEGPEGAAFFDDNRTSIQLRIARLTTNRSWSEVPVSRTRHLVTNVSVAHSELDDEFHVRSNFLVYRSRSDHYQDLFPGARRDVLRRSGSHGFVIARRLILLDQSVLFAVNISTFF